MIEEDWIGPPQTCPHDGILLRTRPGEFYCPEGDYVEKMPEVEYFEVDDDMPTIGW